MTKQLKSFSTEIGLNNIDWAPRKSTNKKDAALKIELYSLEKRVEVLERKLENK